MTCFYCLILREYIVGYSEKRYLKDYSFMLSSKSLPNKSYSCVFSFSFLTINSLSFSQTKFPCIIKNSPDALSKIN